MSRMRRVLSPGAAGIISDLPPQDIPETASTFAQDALYRRGYMEQRKGWKYDGTVADAATNLSAVYRGYFNRKGVARTVTSGGALTSGTGGAYVHNPSSAGFQPGVFCYYGDPIPRCMYRDQMVFAQPDGVTPVQFYGGATTAFQISGGGATTTANEATITSAGFGTIPETGMYYSASWGTLAGGIFQSYQYINAVTSTNSITLEDMRAANTTVYTGVAFPAGLSMFPAMAIYNAGTVSLNGAATATGFGTKWQTDPTLVATFGLPYGGHMLLNDAGTYRIGQFIPSTDTSASVIYTGTHTKLAYDITVPPRGVDVFVHKNSLMFVGGSPYRNRVLIAPPNWNPGLPPGAVPPFDPSSAVTSTTKSYFLLQTVDVPGPYASDPLIAGLSTPGPAILLSRSNAYAIDGAYPDFSQRVLASGAGVIGDCRAAISLDEGQFWCGENGIYWYRNGGIQEITRGKIGREWRDLTSQGVEYATLGISSGYLVVGIKTNGQPATTRSWAYNLITGAWETRLSNTNPRGQYTSRVAGELETLFIVQDEDPGRVINFTKALDGTGSARDDDGTSPQLWYRSGSLTGQQGDVETISRMLDGAVMHNTQDAQAGTNTMDVRVICDDQSGASPGTFTWGSSTPAGTDTFGPGSGVTGVTLSSSTGDAVIRKEYVVNRVGRSHLVELKSTATAATLQKREIHELTLNFRDGRRRA